MRRTRLLLIHGVAVMAAALAFAPVGAARQSGVAYAIKGARVFTATGAPIAGATVVIRNGLIEDVGANVAAPVDAITIDGANMNVYPGLIDMANSAPLGGAAAAAAGAGGGGGGGRGGGAPAGGSFEENERVKRAALLRPDFMAAQNLDLSAAELQQWAGAGVTTVLAVPPSGIFKGQSALVNVVIPPDDPQISGLADNRRGLPIVKSPVATHVNPAGRGGGAGYPGALLGTIAFTKQGFLDAQWQRDAMAQYQRAGAKGPRPVVEPALDALKPALAKEMPTAFDAGEAREIDRVLAMAAQFGLDPIIVGASGAAERTAELAKAKARVILSLNFPGGTWRPRRRRRRRRLGGRRSWRWRRHVAAADAGAGRRAEDPGRAGEGQRRVRVHVRRQHGGRLRPQRGSRDQGRRARGRRGASRADDRRRSPRGRRRPGRIH